MRENTHLMAIMEEIEIAHLGAGIVGRRVLPQHIKESSVVVIEHGHGTFLVNGKRYAPKAHESRPRGRRGFFGMAVVPMLYALGSNKHERKLPKGTDIIKEFALIQTKQSSLSKWERDEVVRIFEHNYYLVQS